MNVQSDSVPSPSSRLATFRIDRLGQGVSNIAVHAQAFRSAVETAVSSAEPQTLSIKLLARSFGDTYLALSEALGAARAGNVMQGPALDALDGIMGRLKDQYSQGVADLRAGVADLSASAPESFTDFCAVASEKVDKLEQFWQTTYEYVPKMRMKM